jgi:uncharacterized protein (TIGR03435 family)
MTPGKNGAKLAAAEPDSAEAPPRGLGKDGFPQVRPQMGEPLNIVMKGKHRLSVRIVSAAQLAAVLSQEMDRTVLDGTGLTGVYDVTLYYSGPPPPGAADIEPEGVDLKTAVEQQLGLKLESRRAPVEFLKIDHADKIAAAN